MISLFERMIIEKTLREEGRYEKAEYIHSNDMCHVFVTEIGLVPVNRENGHFNEKEYELMVQKLLNNS